MISSRPFPSFFGSGPKAIRPPGRGRRRPELEPLEGRALLSGGRVSREFLFTPIPETAPLAQHIHPGLTILIDGKERAIPADIGVGPTGALPIHTHDDSGAIHVESTSVQRFRLRDFFTVWGQPFDRKRLLDRTANGRTKITMTVDGRPSTAFGSLVLRDFQEITIRLTTAGRRPRV